MVCYQPCSVLHRCLTARGTTRHYHHKTRVDEITPLTVGPTPRPARSSGPLCMHVYHILFCAIRLVPLLRDTAPRTGDSDERHA